VLVHGIDGLVEGGVDLRFVWMLGQGKFAVMGLDLLFARGL
jgi:hypothetical protein